MSDYAPGDRVTAYGEVGTVLRLIPGADIYVIDFDNGDHDTATAAAMTRVDGELAVDAWHARLRGIAAAANRPARPVYGQAGRWT